MKVLKITSTLFVSLFACLIEPTASWGDSATKNTKQKSSKKVKKEKTFFLWGSGSISKTRDSFFISRSHTKSYPAFVGFDYKPISSLKLALFYSNTYAKTRTRLTNTTLRSESTAKTNNVYGTITYNFDPNTFLNVAIGYAHTPDTNLSFGRLSNNYIKSKTNIFSVSPSINHSIVRGMFTSAFQFGYSHSNSARKATVDSFRRVIPKVTHNTDSLLFFADFSYKIKHVLPKIESVAPYVQGGLTHNYQDPPVVWRDRNSYYRSQDSWKAGSGLRFFLTNSAFLNAGWQIIGGRSGSINNTVTVTLRIGAF